MSLWGKRDSYSLTGTTVAVTNGSADIVGTGTLFTTELEEGKTITILDVKYKILKITDNAHLTLVIEYAGVTNASLAIASVKGTDIPKYIMQQDLQKVFFVDRTEAQQEENIAKGLNEPGWWFYTTYTDSEGQVRNKADHLVFIDVLSDVSSDAADDVAVVDGTITITSHGSNRTVTAPAATTFVVAATLVGGTGTLAYKWQVATDSFPTYADLSEAGVFSGVATNTLAISDTTGYTGYRFRCVISSDGCTTKTSTPKTLTVN